MPNCEGPGEDKDCPDSSTNVHWSTSDQWLCSKCEDTRFAKQRTKSLRSHSSGDLLTGSNTPSQNATMISDPILSYIFYCMMKSTKQKIVKAAAGYYSSDDITAAKNNLWSSIIDATSYLGNKPNRRGSSNKSLSESNVEDIIDAINKIDNEKKIPVPKFVVEAPDLKMIPKAVPEEMLSISVCERLNALEANYDQMHENIDMLTAQNLLMKQEILQLKSVSPNSYASKIKSGTEKKISHAEETVPHVPFSSFSNPAQPKLASDDGSWRGRGRSRGSSYGPIHGHGHGRGRGSNGYNCSSSRGSGYHARSVSSNGHIYGASVNEINNNFVPHKIFVFMDYRSLELTIYQAVDFI